MSLFGSSQKDFLKKYQEILNQQQAQHSQAMSQQAAYGGLLGAIGGLGSAGSLYPGQIAVVTSVSNQLSVRKMELLPEEVVVHALVGWRRWSVTMFGEELMSNNGVKWIPHEKLTAVCKAGPSIVDPAAIVTGCRGVECGCGIYSYKEREQAEHGDNAPTTVTHVWGEVWLWGRVIEHKHGFRAQFAYPKAFVNTGGIAARMATVYGVKLIPA